MLDLCLTLPSVAPPDIEVLLEPLQAHVYSCPQRIPMLMTAFLEPLRDASAPVGREIGSAPEVQASV